MNEFLSDIIKSCISALILAFLNFCATKIYNYFTGYSKTFLWKNKYPKLETIKIPVSNLDEMKRRTRIVVIDDEDGFPLSIFQSEGYAIERWESVLDYGKLESGFFDIIILDIKGVASNISEDDGLGVLESLKKKNPAQIIIAYSQHSYDLNKTKFWELADETIAKPSDFLKMKSIIDSLINEQYKPIRYINTLHDILKNNKFSDKQIRLLDNALVKKAKNKNDQFDVKDIINSDNSPNELLNQIEIISKTILKFYK